jgi:heme/copper-type cytochrome/quinol oxidase subunit 2
MNRSIWIHRGRLLVLALALVAAHGAGVFAEDDAAAELPVKQIKMTVENWKWTPAVIRVPVGTRVKLSILSYDATHRFDLKALGIKQNLPEDKTTKLEFVADTVGEYKWKCGRPCGNGCPKMRGKLIVEAPEGTEG